MVNSSFFTDGPTNTGSAVASAAPAAFYADPAAAAASAQQAADAAATAAASASAASTAAAAAVAAVSGKANVDSPTFTGVPAAPTPSNGDNSTRLATTAWVQANAVGSAPATATPVMDGTAAVGASAKYAREDHVHPTDTSRAAVSYVDAQIATVAPVSYVDAQDATKAPLASPVLTGTPTAPTATAGDNSTKIATTAFVVANTGVPVRTDVSQSLTGAQKVQARSNIGIDALFFSASLSANQSATSGTFAKVPVDSELSDPQAWYDSTTNFRFQPTLAGKYRIHGQVQASGTSISEVDIDIRKNGAVYSRTIGLVSGAAGSTIIDQIVAFNGTTDYVELWANVIGTGTLQVLGGTAPIRTWFEAEWLGS
jgi:hypothetical protein